MNEKQKIVHSIDRLLLSEYGVPPRNRCREPLDILVQTILSQNTTDTNSTRAFYNLRKRFPKWDLLLNAPVGKIENAIHIGGLAKTKARRIKAIIKIIDRNFGQVSLRFLKDMTVEEASQMLSQLKGVGPKTISCVLLFGCEFDVFPVDTHIQRISKRLGLIRETATLDYAHSLWMELLSPDIAYALHINLITHGRRICRARNPRCSCCCLTRYCRYSGVPHSD